jgi:hypothetical protein
MNDWRMEGEEEGCIFLFNNKKNTTTEEEGIKCN